ncbi:MAG: acylphosphatase [Woeseiaceae bacterium]|nr:acylphosphatase [Woeseiaceae bacterium]
MPSARLFTIKGRVQGVFFRDSTKRVAESLGLTGYAINLADGDVEVLACGDLAAIEQLAVWLQDGPRMAVVEDVASVPVDVEQPVDFKMGQASPGSQA